MDTSPPAFNASHLGSGARYLDENSIGAVQVLPTPGLEELSLRGNRMLKELPMKWFTETDCSVDVRNTSLVAEAPWSVAEWAVALRFENPRATVPVLVSG